MSWPTIKVPNWDTFVSLVRRLDIGVPPSAAYCFRGQPDSRHTLRPTLLRKVNSLRREDAMLVEKTLLNEFRAQAHLLLPASTLPDDHDLLAWWSLMQHHGAPTRLLDWSKSPYVAAYFAVDSEPSQDGAIWYFHANRLARRMDESGGIPFDSAMKRLPELFGAACDHPTCYLFERKTRIERMVTQQGGFTASLDVLADHADLIERALRNDEKEWLRTLIIPAQLKPEFLLQLYRLNVNGVALFPGIDGLGRSMKELATLQANEFGQQSRRDQ
jgi:FRG domain